MADIFKQIRDAVENLDESNRLVKELKIQLLEAQAQGQKGAQLTGLTSALKQAQADSLKAGLALDDLKKRAKEAADQGLGRLARAFADVAQRAGVAEIIGHRVGSLFGGLGGRLGSAIGAAGGAINEAHRQVQQGKASPAEAVLAATIPVLGAFKSVIGEIVSIGPALIGAFQNLVSGVVSYVKFSDPGRVERLNMAMEDLQAAVGAGLAPVVDALVIVFDQLNQVVTSVMTILRPAFTKLADMLQHGIGAALAHFQPVLQLAADLFAAFVDEMKPLFDEFMRSFDAAVPIMRDSLEALRPLATAAFRDALRLVTGHLHLLATGLRHVLEMLGVHVGKGRVGPQGPISHAARPAELIGTEQIGERARLAAFGSRSTEDRVADAMEQNARGLELNFNVMGMLQSGIQKLVNTIFEWEASIGRWVMDLPGNIAQAIRDGVTNNLGRPGGVINAIPAAGAMGQLFGEGGSLSRLGRLFNRGGNQEQAAPEVNVNVPAAAAGPPNLEPRPWSGRIMGIQMV